MADLADIASEIEADRLAKTLSNRQCYDSESESECQECGKTSLNNVAAWAV